MKKRKAPVVLVTLLLLMVGGMVVMGLRDADQKSASAPPPPPTNTDGGVLSGPKAAPSPEEVRGKVEKVTASADGGHQMQIPGDNGPSIAMPSLPKVSKPKPNAESVSAQWYVK